MIRFILWPVSLTAVFAVTMSLLAWAFVFREGVRPTWSPNLVYAGDIGSQRHLAQCYETTCPRVPASRVLACAWREIILEELPTPADDDKTAAQKVCGSLGNTERELVGRTERDIRIRLSNGHA